MDLVEEKTAETKNFSNTNSLFDNNTSSAAEKIVIEDLFKILIVDDLKENQLLLQDILETESRTFITASHGEEALTLAIKQQDIGLILLDVQMPGMDGFEVAKYLRSNPKTRQIPVIFVTANSVQDVNVIEGFASGAVDYLVKPLNVAITRAKVSVFEDLHRQKLALKKIIEERDKVNQQLDKYSRVMAHDLKTPLAGIVSVVSLLKLNESVMESEEAQEEIELLETLAENLSSMITSVLEDSRKLHDENSDEDVSTGHLVKTVISLLQAPSNIKFDVDPNLPVFKTRKVALQQVFQNLIGNAIKYNDKAEGLIEIGCNENEKFHLFFVKDNGPGVDPEFKDSIFEEFGTANTKSNLDSSTGLGLHFLKTAIEEQGGRIWVESRTGRGSTFYFLWKK